MSASVGTEKQRSAFGGAAAMPMLLLGDPSGLAQRLHATLARVQRLLDAAVRRSAPGGAKAAAAFKYTCTCPSMPTARLRPVCAQSATKR